MQCPHIVVAYTNGIKHSANGDDGDAAAAADADDDRHHDHDEGITAPTYYRLLQQIHNPMLNPVSCDMHGTFGMFASATFNLLPT